MAEFKIAFDLTSIIEGGYSNDPDDLGGETYCGISRKYWPEWYGWQIIEKIKFDYFQGLSIKEIIATPSFFKRFKLLLQNDSFLPQEVYKFYKIQFWNRFLGDYIVSQEIANELYDTAVNKSVHDAVKWLQRSLNALNKKELYYNNLIVDGLMGINTLNALDTYIKLKGSVPLLKSLNILQGYHYLSRCEEDESQEKFYYGWLKRVNL